MSIASQAIGREGMVVAGHPSAADVALRTLRAGGSVADAAIAGAAVMTVALPQACTLGGDAFALVHDAAQNETIGLNASGPSPASTAPAAFASGIPERGALTCTMPGVVGGWQGLHDRFGRVPWRELLQPAMAMAREGFALSKGVARATEVYAKLLDSDPGSRALFRRDGRPLQLGERLVQAALAQTLEMTATEGARGFYEGEIAASLADACQAQGGWLRASDFRGYAPEWVAPLATRYRDHDVRVMPPNSYGLYLLLQLMALDQATLATTPLDSPERVAALVRAAQAAFHVGNRAVADPRFAPEPAAPLLGAAGRDRLRGAAAARPPNRGGTAVISVMDPAGNGVTIVQSIFLVFGSGVSDAKTGILLSNRMIGFTNEPGHPNAVAPRKRPAHTLCPVMVFGKHGLRFALGTPGGPGQTITLAQVLQALLDANRPLREAITAPRWSMDLGAAALVEATMPPSTIAGAQRLGIALEQAKPDSPFFGSAEGIERAADGTLTGVADFRRDAGVAGA